MLTSGMILATLDGDDLNGIGTNATLDVYSTDIFYLDLTTTTMGATSTTAGSATGPISPSV